MPFWTLCKEVQRQTVARHTVNAVTTHHRKHEPLVDADAIESGRVGPDSAGQSGDTQGLSSIAEAADESVEELSDTGQAREAEIVQGVEDAGDHPEQPVPQRRP